MRDALVTHDMPQKNWPTVASRITNFAFALESADVMIEIDVPPPSLTALRSVAANVSASSTNQPITPDQNTDRHTPLAAPSAAPRVSSEMCADASYPVCVYIVSRKPWVRMNSQKKPVTLPPSQPELLILCVKTKLTDWWCEGTNARMPITIRMPITCHQTDTLFRAATRVDE